MTRLAYSIETAAEECSVSMQTIRDAIAAGHLVKVHPKGKNGPIAKQIILHSDLMAWLEDAPGERVRGS